MKDTTDNIGEVSVRPLTREMQDRYLSYAISTITGRALPDARDGLKPVQRRILYAMADLKLSSSGAFRKSAKIAGDVMGNYHPHGDSAIYDAMVRMAQGFSMREPLVDGQGNFGNIDGDNAAASRYTEARMTRSAEMLLKDISDDAVPMRSNYDGSSEEPEVLPAAFPNILVNGSSGIAVGMATNIPPHEPKDAIAATIALMKDPAIPGSELAAIIRGPDFPTGGVLVDDPDATLNAYETGRGTFRLRSKWTVEDAGKAGWVVVVTEIPYQVQKLRLMERLVELADDKSKLPLVADVRDESSEDVRIVIEPKSRSVDPAMMMASLFATSDLEIRFQMNMNVLLPGLVPKVCGLKEVLSVFVDHREETLLRRSRHGLGKAVARMSVLEGYLIAYVNLDEVIRIIREASDPGAEMRARFGMTQDQTEAVLSMRLRSLRRLEEEQIVKELAALRTEKARLEGLINDPDLRRSEMISEMVSASLAFGGSSRRTAIEADTSPRVDKGVSEAFVAKEPLTVTLSAMGWVKSVKSTGRQDQDMKFRDGDGPLLTCQAFTTDDVLLFSSDGRVFSLRANDIPGGRGFGEAVRMMTDLPQDASVVAIRPFRQDGRSLMVSSSGTGMIVADQQVIARTRTGKRVMTLDDDATLIASIDTDGFDTVVTVSNDDRMLSFPLSEVPEVAKGRGVWLQRGAGISAVRSVALAQSGRPLRYALSDGSFAETADLSPWSGRRSGAGKKAPVGVSRLLTARC